MSIGISSSVESHIRRITLESTGRSFYIGLMLALVLQILSCIYFAPQALAADIGQNFTTHHDSVPNFAYPNHVVNRTYENILAYADNHEFKWSMVIHGSHYGLIKDNVVYNVAGSAIVTEDGTESYNVIDGNFVFRARSVDSGWRF